MATHFPKAATAKGAHSRSDSIDDVEVGVRRDYRLVSLEVGDDGENEGQYDESNDEDEGQFESVHDTDFNMEEDYGEYSEEKVGNKDENNAPDYSPPHLPRLYSKHGCNHRTPSPPRVTSTITAEHPINVSSFENMRPYT